MLVQNALYSHQRSIENRNTILKDENTPFEISWKIVKYAQPYSPLTNRCNLCLWKTFYITTANKDSTLKTD